MSQMLKVPMLTQNVGVLITIHELSLFLMLQIPKMPTITVSLPTQNNGGEGKDLNELTRSVTASVGKKKHTHHTKGGAGGKDLNYLTVMEESKPTKPQERTRICQTSPTCKS